MGYWSRVSWVAGYGRPYKHPRQIGYHDKIGRLWLYGINICWEVHPKKLGLLVQPFKVTQGHYRAGLGTQFPLIKQ